MRPRPLLITTVVGALVLFAWQAVSHAALGLPEKGLRAFPNDSATTAAQSIRALAPQNGVYFSRFGVFAAVDISPDYADKTRQFASMMAKQVVVDLAIVFILALLVDRLAGASVWSTGLTYSALALAYMGCVDVSNWIWWNFPMSWTLGNVADQVIGFFLVGATLAALRNRLGEPVVRTAERAGVRAPGGLPVNEPGSRVPR
jgi:hypothetical protein